MIVDEVQAETTPASTSNAIGECGLLPKQGGDDVQVSLKAVHIKASLLGTCDCCSQCHTRGANRFVVTTDMIGRVVVMQHYRNDSEHAIEAKYVR
jgi:hypothetical protein